MIVAASTTPLADSRGDANLAANVAVAEPTATDRSTAARPPFSLNAAYSS
jgi:hypothetical protein